MCGLASVGCLVICNQQHPTCGMLVVSDSKPHLLAQSQWLQRSMKYPYLDIWETLQNSPENLVRASYGLDQPSPLANCIILFLANHQTTCNLSELTCIPHGQLVTKRHGSLASSPSSSFPMLSINMVFSNGPLWGHHSTLQMCQHILYAFTFKPRSDQGTHSRHLFLLRHLAALSFSAQWEKDV